MKLVLALAAGLTACGAKHHQQQAAPQGKPGARPDAPPASTPTPDGTPGEATPEGGAPGAGGNDGTADGAAPPRSGQATSGGGQATSGGGEQPSPDSILAPPCPAAESARYAETVASVQLKAAAAAAPTGDPQRAVDGVQGAGDDAGGTDVFSLDNATDGALTLAWKGAALCDGPGADLVVFENAFRFGTKTFIEPLIVSVSADGGEFVEFPHDYTAPDEAKAPGLGDPAAWRGFAGLTPVRYAEGAGKNAFDADAAGGDAFDLAALPDGPATAKLRAQGVRFVRLTAAPAAVNPDTGVNYPQVPYAGRGFADIDGVYGRYVATTPPPAPEQP